MPERKTIEEVRKRISELSDDKVILLSEEYINNKQPLDLRCSCGNIFQRDFEHINRGQILCQNCSKKIVSENYRLSLDYIKDKIKESGCEYISGDYVNNKSLLTIRCKCGNIFQKSWAKFSSGQDHCPDCGKKNLVDSKLKFSAEQAKDEFLKYGFTMIGEYKDLLTKTKCICSRGHKCDIVLGYLQHHQSNCPICHEIDYGGWGVDFDKAVRARLSKWRSDIKNAYNNTCPITGYTSGLDVHHLLSLTNILNDISNELGIEKSKTINTCDFKDDESDYFIFMDKIISYHDIYSGILIHKDIHIKFHQEYGYGNNTPQQFNEFLINHYSITLNEIQSKLQIQNNE